MNIIPFSHFINEEVGMRNLSTIVKEYKEFEIWFHQDLDGVTSALAMKTFLETYYNLKMVDCHIIQYGGLEYAVKYGRENTLKCLVDFAHSKPMFHIATDHHDNQAGAEDTESTYFKGARSNVETISGEISYNEIFTNTDLQLIRTVDSADFVKYNIKPKDVSNSIFNYDKSLSASKNRFMMGFVVNRLLLAYKNKRINVKSLNKKNNHKNRNILECLVFDSKPSLYSLYNNLRNYINNAKTNDRLGRLSTPEEIERNLSDYIKQMKNYGDNDNNDISQNDIEILKLLNNKKKFHLPGIAKQLNISEEELNASIKKLMAEKYLFWTRYNNYFVGDKGQRLIKQGPKLQGKIMDPKYKILMQYGGGNMMKPGSYDRYVPFRNNPDTNFFAIAWPMGLIQVSCNPFKEKELEFINLGNIAGGVLNNHKKNLKRIFISLHDMKKDYETSQDWKKMKKAEGDDYKGIGFKYADLKAFYINNIFIWDNENKKSINIDITTDDRIESIMNTNYENLSSDEKKYLRKYKISCWDIIDKNSGGHPSITNISGLSFLKYNTKGLKYFYKTEEYTSFMKNLLKEIVNELKSIIDNNSTSMLENLNIKKYKDL